MTHGTPEEVIVIGGGVIGVCSAYYLALSGKPVIIIEKDKIGTGCSYGNAGLLAPSHSVPLAAPGVVAKALKSIWDARSLFYLKPRFDLEFVAWLWRFVLACNENRVHESLPVIRDLSWSSLQLFEQLAHVAGPGLGYQRNGLLMLFENQNVYEKGCKQASLLRDVGIRSQQLTLAEVSCMEPNVVPTIAGGIYFPDDAHLNPFAFVQGVARAAQEMGVKVQTETEVLGFRTSEGNITAVRTTRGDLLAGSVVLAAGAWSLTLSRALRMRLPIQAAKGYSVSVKRPKRSLQRPLLLNESKVLVTPIDDIVRISGILELAGFDTSISRRRVDAIWRAARTYVRGLGEQEPIETWSGLRPCTPDGLPIITRTNRFGNLIIATGHGMLGLTLGPITGKLVSQLVCNEPPELDLTPLRLERFQ